MSTCKTCDSLIIVLFLLGLTLDEIFRILQSCHFGLLWFCRPFIGRVCTFIYSGGVEFYAPVIKGGHWFVQWIVPRTTTRLDWFLQLFYGLPLLHLAVSLHILSGAYWSACVLLLLRLWYFWSEHSFFEDAGLFCGRLNISGKFVLLSTVSHTYCSLWVFQVFIATIVDNFLYPVSAVYSHVFQHIEWAGVQYWLQNGKICQVFIQCQILKTLLFETWRSYCLLANWRRTLLKHFILELESWWPLNFIILLVENANAVLLHFTLELLRD